MEVWLAAFMALLAKLERWIPYVAVWFATKEADKSARVQNTLEAVEAAQEARESVRNDTTFERLRRAQAAGRLRGVSATEYESE